jgi:hypothetical protein
MGKLHPWRGGAWANRLPKQASIHLGGPPVISTDVCTPRSTIPMILLLIPTLSMHASHDVISIEFLHLYALVLGLQLRNIPRVDIMLRRCAYISPFGLFCQHTRRAPW